MSSDLNRHTEPMLVEVDRLLATIQENYGLTRDQAANCLENMAHALVEHRPGDPGFVVCFEEQVEMCAGCFEGWALKVGREVLGWRDHA